MIVLDQACIKKGPLLALGICGFQPTQWCPFQAPAKGWCVISSRGAENGGVYIPSCCKQPLLSWRESPRTGMGLCFCLCACAH